GGAYSTSSGSAVGMTAETNDRRTRICFRAPRAQLAGNIKSDIDRLFRLESSSVSRRIPAIEKVHLPTVGDGAIAQYLDRMLQLMTDGGNQLPVRVEALSVEDDTHEAVPTTRGHPHWQAGRNPTGAHPRFHVDHSVGCVDGRDEPFEGRR